MKLAVFGATGRTGRPLIEQALERGHEVVAFARNADDIPATLRTHDAVTVVEGDAYSGDGVAVAVSGGDTGDAVGAVVSVLGQTSDGPDDLLTVAGRHILDSMDDAGVTRIVTLVGAGVREDGESVSLGGKVMGSLLKVLAGSVLDDAKRHVDDVRASDTRWTVVRAPRLTDGDDPRQFSHGTELKLGVRDSASRGTVAQFIIECLEDDLYVEAMPKVTDR
ncbi:NmrA family protein [Haloferax mucosum ATCC BAA-1512]|uniref:NmrA family protein n=1 Tax=Haloferax mucosum ATCC BAA-1512 TaxID=662479 RepID=M0IDZ7_9EURY|nr:NAD(P)H-binding protein [Haloferax mucosum]ELZ94073.1 NmrA family protein [Haloferax mucosum ATCC BAA-1512]